MPKNPPRNKPGFRSSGAPRSAAAALAGLLARNNMESALQGNPDSAGALRENLRSRLPAELSPRLLEARVRDGELVVFAESAAWAGRLKLAVSELIASPQRPEAVPVGARVVAKLMPRDGFRR